MPKSHSSMLAAPVRLEQGAVSLMSSEQAIVEVTGRQGSRRMREVEVVILWEGGIRHEIGVGVAVVGNTCGRLSVWVPGQWGCLFFHLCVFAICCWPTCMFPARGAAFGTVDQVEQGVCAG